MDNTYYIVNISPRYIDNFAGTTIRKGFCGRIVNQTKNALYFELNDNNSLVIIPHEWIENMAPSELNTVQENSSSAPI